MLAAVAVAMTGTAGAASAAPLPVVQSPAQGIITTGIGYWTIWSAPIRVRTGPRGAVLISSPGGDACDRGAAGHYVRFDYTSVSTGRGGSVTVRPCPGPFSGQLEAAIFPGAGRLIGTIHILSDGGPWQVPGAASATVG